MSAYIAVAAVLPDTSAEPRDLPAELRALLASAGVVAGVDEVLLQELAVGARSPEFQRSELLIASGVAALVGASGSVELAFEQGLAPGRVSDDGHMNFLERGLLKGVASEQVIATWHAAGAGSAGFTVTGKALPARAGAEPKLALGAGVVRDGNGAVRARHAGVVLSKPGISLDVVAEHVHRGAVDLHSGHLDMQGSLVIQGDVERLLQARASGDLEVLGSVSGGSLRASGSIRVSGNVRGGDGARVVAEHDVTLKSGESADVTAGALLRVHEAVNSQLQARQIVVSGRLRGGAATAEATLVVKEAGTLAGSATLLCAGEPLQLPDLAEVQRAVVMQKLRRMAERGGVREAIGARGGTRAKGGKLGRLDAAWSADELKERAHYAERRAELERAARIEVGTAHPGVELRIGSARLGVEQTARGLRYALDPATGRLSAERIAE